MNIQMPVDFDRYLYHFTSAEKALLYILPNHQLRFSSPLNTNDLQENKTYGSWQIFDEFDTFKQIELKKAFKSYLEKNCRMLCFTGDYIDCETQIPTAGYKSPTMWAHYANKYTGVCLVFNKKLLLNAIQGLNCFKDNVGYKSELHFPQVSQRNYQEAEAKAISDYCKNNYKELFYTKHYHWSFENEYRILHFQGNDYLDIRTALAGIFYGFNFDKELIPALKRQVPVNDIEKVDFFSGRFQAIPLEQLEANKDLIMKKKPGSVPKARLKK
jgi:hypothetical protein